MEKQIEIILANENDVDAIIQMMAELYEQMEDKTWFYPDEDDAVRDFVTRSGFALKAMVGEQMVGFFFGYAPGKERENMGTYMGFSGEEMQKVAHMETAMVIPEFRGRGIQRLLMAKAEETFKERGYTHLMGTAHPDNIFSVKNFEKQGYQIVAEARKYGGLRRYVFYKNV